MAETITAPPVATNAPSGVAKPIPSTSNFYDELVTKSMPKEFGERRSLGQVMAEAKPLEPVVEAVTQTQTEPEKPSAGADLAKIVPPVVEPVVTTEPAKKPSLAEGLNVSLESALNPADLIATEQPQAAPVEVDIPAELPGTSKEAQAAFAKVTKLLREANHKLKDISNKQVESSPVEAAKAIAPFKEQVEKLSQERDQLLGIISSVKFEARPEIKERYLDPINSAEQYIRDVCKISNTKTTDILEAITVDSRAERTQIVRDACSTMHPNDAAEVEKAVNAVYTLKTQLKELNKKAGEITADSERKAAEQFAANQAEYRLAGDQAIDSQFKAFVQDPFIKVAIEKDPQAKALFDQIYQAAKAADADNTWMGNHAMRANLILQGLSYRPTVQMLRRGLERALQESKQLKEENLKLRNAGPSLQRTTAPARNDGRPESYQDTINKLF